MKIKAGMYVRTKIGIKKIYDIDENKTKWKYLYKLKKQDGDGSIDLGSLCEEDIIGEPSYRPIDLIEVGDYVNGYKVTTVNKQKSIVYSEDEKGYFINGFYEDEIKTIVTKEQFEKMSYRVN